jgi:hypothetical protein
MNNEKPVRDKRFFERGMITPSIFEFVVICAVICALFVAIETAFQQSRSRGAFTGCVDSLNNVKTAIELTTTNSGIGGLTYEIAADPTQTCKNMGLTTPCTAADIDSRVRQTCYDTDGASNWSFVKNVTFDATYSSFSITGTGKEWRKCAICVTNNGTAPKDYGLCKAGGAAAACL